VNLGAAEIKKEIYNFGVAENNKEIKILSIIFSRAETSSEILYFSCFESNK
jgi:hypothetical protein